MKRILSIALVFILMGSFKTRLYNPSWIRINLVGYRTQAPKVAVWCSKDNEQIQQFQIVDILSGKPVYTGKKVESFGAYGPFKTVTRLDFSDYTIEGRYVIVAGGVSSPEFTIASDVYRKGADFCLRYMRQQRSGFNPFLKDSCHTKDGYVLYGSSKGIKDSSYVYVSGGWHDASDYLQYATTSANATYHLLMAYRDFPDVFNDIYQANGLAGSNKIPDVLDEAKWGLDWLLKMHPRKDLMFNQVGDDRDHAGMRIPKEDSFYGKGIQRPVYFINGKPQQRGKFLNQTTGGASTAGKFASAFALGERQFKAIAPSYAKTLREKSLTAVQFGEAMPGVAQTVSVKSPYIYAEGNWMDDMELAYAALYARDKDPQQLANGMKLASKEPLTPWMETDTAAHYQWYPFINIGHYEWMRQLKGEAKKKLLSYYKKGIEQVWSRAQKNGFYRGVPFIWCSNNLTVSFAIQCYWYRIESGDSKYQPLEQACIDWLFGVNPWGTSMVYGYPAWGDTPVDPHSAFTQLKKYHIDGGLVDGPVYTNIYNNLIGIKLYNPDSYAAFQSNLAVYHDDFGDYSTNEPTMDGTASLIYLLAALAK